MPGIAVSSPVVWGEIVCSSPLPSAAIRTRAFAPGCTVTSKPSNDVSMHSWRLLALDKKTGKVLWERVAHEGVPKTKRHPKSSQASPTPVTDGRHVVVSFGSEGLYAYDMRRQAAVDARPGCAQRRLVLRPRLRVGHRAARRSSGRTSVIVQCDIQKNSFVAAFDRDTGRPLWRTERDEIPSWSTPTVWEHDGQAELVTQATTFIRGYDPRPGKSCGGSSATPRSRRRRRSSAHGIVVVTNGYRGIQPIFAIKLGGERRPDAPEGKDAERLHRLEHDEGRSLHADAGRLRRPAIRPSPTTASSPAGTRRRARRSTSSGSAMAARTAPRPWRPTARSTCRAKTATSTSSRRGRSSSCCPAIRSARW